MHDEQQKQVWSFQLWGLEAALHHCDPQEAAHREQVFVEDEVRRAERRVGRVGRVRRAQRLCIAFIVMKVARLRGEACTESTVNSLRVVIGNLREIPGVQT